MVHQRPVRLWCGVLATGLLPAGCSGVATPQAAGSEGATTSSGTRSSPTPTRGATGLDFTADPGRTPKTAAEAGRLARAVAAVPINWGPGYLKRTPYESTPGAWPVLDAICV
ncbi:hypothetical protein [Streptomyces sp. NPDC050548]|uniref:hypothetical protein n=1 Tax=Streptomyces sp. NPDC050548 TaxID=3365629 RepID=UPI0037AC2477